jgi:hypothetical protein
MPTEAPGVPEIEQIRVMREEWPRKRSTMSFMLRLVSLELR